MDETTTTDLVETQGTGAGVHEGILVDSEGNALTAEQVEAMREETAAQPETGTAEVRQDNSTELDSVERSASTSVDSETQDLINWARKKGGFDTEDLSSGAIKALKIARAQDQEFHKRSTEQSELKRALEHVSSPYGQNPYFNQPYQPYPPVQPQPQITGYDEYGQPVYSNVNQPVPPQAPPAPTIDPKTAMLEFRVMHRDFEDGSDLDNEMGKIVAEDPYFWAGRLDQAYRIAKANLSGSDVESQIEQARREERERLTRKSALAQPSAQATTQPQSTAIRTAADAERFMATASKEEIAERRTDLEAALGLELGPR